MKLSDSVAGVKLYTEEESSERRDSTILNSKDVFERANSGNIFNNSFKETEQESTN